MKKLPPRIRAYRKKAYLRKWREANTERRKGYNHEYYLKVIKPRRQAFVLAKKSQG